MFIGETPGIRDRDRPYTGWVGREFNDGLLPGVLHKSRESIYMTNAAKCHSARLDGKKVDPEIATACAAHHLPGELERVSPEIVVLMGAAACRIATPIGTGTPAIDLELHHGRPIEADIAGVRVIAIPTFHPSEAGHDTSMLRYIRDDFTAIGEALAHGPTLAVYEDSSVADYREIRTIQTLDDYLRLDPYAVAIDTENTPDGRIWCATLSTAAGTGRLIRTQRLYEYLAAYLTGPGSPLVLMHNSPHDLAVLAQAGIYPSRFIDTMQSAYHLGHYGQGLKTLAYRMAAMTMTSFEDTVGPYAEQAAIDYLMAAESESWPKPIPLLDPKTAKMRKPQPIGGKIKKILKKIDGSVQTAAAWGKIDRRERELVEIALGPMPVPDVSGIPMAVAVGYACRDADATYRIWPVLNRMGAVVVRGVR